LTYQSYQYYFKKTLAVWHIFPITDLNKCIFYIKFFYKKKKFK